MSAGPPPRDEGRDPGGPVPAGRAHILGRLQAELRQAEGCLAHERAAELRTQISQLSAGNPADPSRETTGRPAARRQRNR